jgi:hypothetical protein
MILGSRLSSSRVQRSNHGLCDGPLLEGIGYFAETRHRTASHNNKTLTVETSTIRGQCRNQERIESCWRWLRNS